MKKAFCFLLCLMLTVLGAACAEVSAVKPLSIVLDENSTTGYTWTYTVGDESILSVEDNGYTAPDADLVGAPGTHAWSIVGLKEGDATVDWLYAQGWENGEIGCTVRYVFHVDADGAVSIEDCDAATIVLDENPSTGYEWTYTVDGESVAPILDRYEMPEAAGEGQLQAVGAGSTHRWMFAAVGEGDAVVTFAYARSWEQGVEPIRTVAVTLHADADGHVTEVDRVEK